MKYCRFALAILVSTMLHLPSQAGIIFGKGAKANPSERVPQLIATAKSDPDESKRESAVKELREFDAAAFPEIMPTIIDILQHDPKPAVRSEAVSTLNKLRPVSRQAELALQQATHDSSMRVRLPARSAVVTYKVTGIFTSNKIEEPRSTVHETPVAIAPPAQPKRTIVPALPRSKSISSPTETAPPPLADPVSPASVVRPISTSPVPVTPAPAQMPNLATPPTAIPDAGPDLSPGK